MAGGQQLDDLMVECIDPRCEWEGRRGDHVTHKATTCPVRGGGAPRASNSSNRASNTDSELTPSGLL